MALAGFGLRVAMQLDSDWYYSSGLKYKSNAIITDRPTQPKNQCHNALAFRN